MLGLREEVRLGQRSQIDLLDAQRELVASEVRVANSDHDHIVAAYTLLSAAGLLTPVSTTGRRLASQVGAKKAGWGVKSVRPPAGKALVASEKP